jgi:hypothetical protein
MTTIERPINLYSLISYKRRYEFGFPNRWEKGYMCCTALNQAIILIRDVLLKVSITAGLGEAQ